MNLAKAWNAELKAASFFAVKNPIQEVCTGSNNMLKHGLRPIILILTIIHVTFGGITETKGLVFDFLIFSQFSLIFSGKRNLRTKKAEQFCKTSSFE